MSTPHVLVVNAGSSSLKYSLVDATTGETPGDGLVERIGESSSTLVHQGPGGGTRTEGAVADHEAAFRLALDAFGEHGPDLAAYDVVAVGHRVVHGGEHFSQPVVITDEVIEAVTDLIPLAPLHNPANLSGIAGARALFPDLPHVAIFDTAFHQTLPPHAYTYAVPRDWVREHGIRRYGFHGTSFSFVSQAAADLLGKPLAEVNLVVAHLGNGASISAVRGGESVETSMGMTPLEGLVMGTRSGDVDPALHAHLHRELGWSLDEIDRILNRESGLKGLAGENDFREVLRLRDAGDPAASLAFDVFCHRLRKYVGAYYAVLGEVDAIVFTGGVGENAAPVRSASLAGLSRLGITVDGTLNEGRVAGPHAISPANSAVAVLVVPTNEEWEIARQSVAALP
ncbi:acetate kinase [Nocardioides sp. JQ2195]|uniref:acetate/propionate family kinase n=1 Tax=Nocardioides sp. JQ2195 TaxID=2592334 RepID=UPI00143ED7A5|nr:acetate kinase [Nocardioides sp. JQ2195]QIX27922.1 acetate kinase [Nocardioides sp. JQ2195]